VAPGPVLSPTRITPEYNGKIRPQPDRENAFARASGGGDGTGIEPSVEIVAEAKAPEIATAVPNHIEIELAGGHRMRISGCYDPDTLARLIRGLSA
jgi:hypothetical protein